MPPNGVVYVWLSLGQSPSVPSFVGQRLELAISRAQNDKLFIQIAGKEYSSAQVNTIIRQDPIPGAGIPGNRRINVWVSLGSPLVPDILGQTPAAAERYHSKLNLIIQVAGEEYSNAKPGTIIRQDPNTGAYLPKDRRVRVWISRGPRPTVPNLISQQFEAANNRYYNKRLVIRVTGKEYSKAPVNTIIRQDPIPGALLPQDRQIKVVVSSGPPLVPDVVDLTPAAAANKHRNLKLSIQVVDQVYSTKKPGLIVNQDPKAGAPLPGHRGIRVQVSRGPRPQLKVPDVLGLTPTEAQNRYRNLNLSIEVAGEDFSANKRAGTILSQNPKPGAFLPPNRRIAVRVSLGPKPRVIAPDLLGLTPTEAQNNHPDLKLVIRVIGQKKSDQKPGTIIRQDPKAGVPLPDNHLIAVQLSSGSKILDIVPDLRGQTRTEAERRHRRLELAIYVQGHEESNEPADVIIRQKPIPGAPVPDDRRIAVWISRGIPIAATVPDLLGQTLEGAENRYRDLQLSIFVAGQEESIEPADIIIRQNPNPGARLPYDRSIDVWLSMKKTTPTGIWPLLGWGGGGFLLLGGLGFIVKKVWSNSHKPPSTSLSLSLQIKSHLDGGDQVINTQNRGVADFSINLRIHPDRGEQRIEQYKKE